MLKKLEKQVDFAYTLEDGEECGVWNCGDTIGIKDYGDSYEVYILDTDPFGNQYWIEGATFTDVAAKVMSIIRESK